MTDEPIREEFETKEAWLQARRAAMTSTDAAVILGLEPYGKTPLRLYAEKLNLVAPDTVATEAMDWGVLLEEPIARRYETVTGRLVTKDNAAGYVLFRRPETSHAATPDFFIDDNTHQGRGVLEVKNVGPWKLDEWTSEPPLIFQVQLQWQLYVMGYGWGAIAALIGGQKLLHYTLRRNDRFIRMVLVRVDEFWARVDAKDAPLAHAADQRLLSTLYADPIRGKIIDLPPDAVIWDVQLQRAKEQLKELERLKDEAEASLKSLIGDAEVGVLPDGAGVYSWLDVTRAGYEVPPGRYRQLRRRKT